MPALCLLHPASLLAFCVGVCAIGGLAKQASGVEPIVVEFIDGNFASGVVDSQTDAQRLWIRREEDNVQLCSGYEWSRIKSVRQGAHQFSVRDFQRESQNLKTPGKSFGELIPVTTNAPPEDLVAPPNADRSLSRKVESLHIEARLSRWGPGAATDGVQVLVFPLDAAGRVVPVNGQLDLVMLGELTNARGGEFTVLSPQFRELERSSELLYTGNFNSGPATVRMPFRQIHPDVDFDIATPVVVHARLGIPGQGVFEASVPFVPVREFSPIRDQLQLYTGRRFFPQEDVNRLPP